MTPSIIALCLLLATAPGLDEQIQPLIAAHQGEVAVVVKHLKSAETFAHHADVAMPTASLIKLPIMIEAYRQASAGQFSLDDKLTLTADDKVPGSGILTTHFSPGLSLSVRDAIRLMIAYSDNTATNLVLTKIGLPATNATMDEWKLPHTKIHSLVFKGKTTIAPERSKAFGLGSTTASEMVALLSQLHERKIVTPAMCDEMLGHLRACEDHRLGKLLPAKTKVASKTGSVNAVRTAAGIVETPGGAIAICVLTNKNRDQRWTDDNAGEVLTSKIALAAYEHFAQGQAIEVSPALLRLGSSGAEVSELQKALNAKLQPAPDLAVDGEFGPLTQAALMQFQKMHGLKPSGELTPETAERLK